jgi:hypothetical protein
VKIKPPLEIECENKGLVRKYSATIKVWSGNVKGRDHYTDLIATGR